MYRFYGKYKVPEEWGLNLANDSHVVLGVREEPILYLEIEFSQEERCLVIHGISETEPNFFFFANRKPSHQGTIRDTGKLFTLYYMLIPHNQRKLPERAMTLNYHASDLNFIQNREIWGNDSFLYTDE